MTKELHDLNWFEDRIGKRIFRDTNDCSCDTCKDVFKNGLVVHDKNHASYIFDCQFNYFGEGNHLFYFDKPIGL